MTLLTGFLGAGKTTVLNAVLSDNASGPVAVVVNEFGEAGLDHDLIAQSSEEVILMQSGCLCCSIRGDLSKTVIDLLGRRAKEDVAFERIVIETTGLADPAPILQTLLVDDLLAANTRMDGIVTVADAANGAATLDAQFEAVSQAATADMIVLSKTDLVTPTEVSNFEDRLKALNPCVKIIHAIKGAGIAGQLWGLSALTETANKEDVLSWTTGSDQKLDPLANLSGFAPAQSVSVPQSTHDTRIGSASIVLDVPLTEEAFDSWLDTLIAFKGPDILRVKGIVFIEGFDAPFVFHGVQHIFDPPVRLDHWPRDDRRTRIVVIGRDISRTDLQRSLDLLRTRTSEPLSDIQTEKVAP